MKEAEGVPSGTTGTTPVLGTFSGISGVILSDIQSTISSIVLTIAANSGDAMNFESILTTVAQYAAASLEGDAGAAAQLQTEVAAAIAQGIPTSAVLTLLKTELQIGTNALSSLPGVSLVTGPVDAVISGLQGGGTTTGSSTGGNVGTTAGTGNTGSTTASTSGGIGGVLDDFENAVLGIFEEVLDDLGYIL